MKKYLIVFKIVLLTLIIGCEDDDGVVSSEPESITIAKFLEATNNISGYTQYTELARISILDKALADEFGLAYTFLNEDNGYPQRKINIDDFEEPEKLNIPEVDEALETIGILDGTRENRVEEIEEINEIINSLNGRIKIIEDLGGDFIDTQEIREQIEMNQNNLEEPTEAIKTIDQDIELAKEVTIYVSVYDLFNKESANITVFLPRNVSGITTSTIEDRFNLGTNMLDLVLRGIFKTEQLINQNIAPISSDGTQNLVFEESIGEVTQDDEVVFTYNKISINDDPMDPTDPTDMIFNPEQLEIDRSRRNLEAKSNGIVHDIVDNFNSNNDITFPIYFIP